MKMICVNVFHLIHQFQISGEKIFASPSPSEPCKRPRPIRVRSTVLSFQV